MADLIDSVADLIDVRDRDGLEATLARIAFELAGARTLIFWRVYHRGERVVLRRRVVLPTARDGAVFSEGEDIPIAAAAEPLRLAFESKSVARWRERPGDRTGCVFPVFSGSELLGLLEIEVASELDRERIALVSGMLRVYRSHLAALEYGDTDELTGLANRRTFDDHFNRIVLAETLRKGGTRVDDGAGPRAHLAVADIDFFKRVNDRFGHPYGDEVLVLFAGLMRDSFREGDRLFRFGGEEFVVLMANCGVDNALAAFERFRAAVEAFQFPQVGRVTVSIGVTSLHPGDSGSAAFGRADEALYAAKHRGRNCVLISDSLAISSTRESRRPQVADVELF
jgi:diguanylate cyclase (GGDEF)-like protein